MNPRLRAWVWCWMASLGGLLLGAACAPGQAQGQTVFVLPPQGDQHLDEARAQAAESLVAALKAQGLKIVRYQERADTLPEGDERLACDSIDCAGSWIQTTDASLAAAVAVWSGSDSDQPGSVFVTLLDTQSARYPGEADIEDGGVASATRAALLQARSRQLLGPGPWVAIDGKPRGAAVYIDDARVGSLPYHAALGAGRHALRVEAEGYAPHEQRLDMPIKQSQEVTIDVSLLPEQAATSAAGDPSMPPSHPPRAREGTTMRYPILGPALLGGAGLIAITASTVAISKADCEARAPDGECLVGTGVKTTPVTALGLGGVAAVVGALVWFFSGAEEVPASEHAGIQLDVGPGSMQVEGRF